MDYYKPVIIRLNLLQYLRCWIFYLAYIPKYIFLALYALTQNYPRRVNVILQKCDESEATFQTKIINPDKRYTIQ